MQYRRARTKGGTYFFTVVTHNRRKILCKPENIDLLRSAFQSVMEKHPYHIDAIVLLPDHLHCIWTLPPDDNDFSTRWRLIKSAFSRKCDSRYKGKISASRQIKKETSVWQRRFWEHAIRDENDFGRHVEYIHYNPVKHNLVNAPRQWAYSSFHKYVGNGLCDLDWGANNMTFDKDIGRE
jgi:putative transposase